MLCTFARRALAAFSLMAVCACASARAAEPADKPPTDPDFKIQGEYSGMVGDEKIGVQLVALGQGKFKAVGYKGGLPGDGWDKGDKHEVEAEVKDGVLTINHNDHVAVVKDGAITINGSGGEKLAEFKKVERKSPTLGLAPPAGAVVLFDGKNVDNFPGAKITEDGLLVQGSSSKPKLRSGTLHVEFETPWMPEARGQGRGNSGVYLQSRYEVQVLDSFGLKGENNECGGIYTISSPSVNMCFPPLTWQTYDIEYTEGKFDGNKKTANAKMTVKHNGEVVQKDVELTHATTAAPQGEGADAAPLYLQDHGNPVRYRNIWWVEKN